MNIEYYRNFISIVECGSILGASKKICIAQPALSHQLKVMESEFGTELLYRGARNVKLTEAGKILYRKAKSICSLSDAAFTEISNQLSGIRGTLSIALPPTNSSDFTKILLDDFIKNYPNVNLELHELTSQEVANCVETGICEIGFIRAPISNSYLFDIYPIKSERIVAVIPQNHPLSKNNDLKLSDLKFHDLVVPRGCTKTVKDAMNELRFEPRFYTITTSRTLAITLANLKNAIALIPIAENDNLNNEINIKSISDYILEVPRAFILKKNSPISVMAQNFLKFHNISLPPYK